jgi:hypothetical protein
MGRGGYGRDSALRDGGDGQEVEPGLDTQGSMGGSRIHL